MKPNDVRLYIRGQIRHVGSIHPQGWVPIETAFVLRSEDKPLTPVAFTPKGGCPLKRAKLQASELRYAGGSIHPQGWVPIETILIRPLAAPDAAQSSIHPQGWVPIETYPPTFLRAGISYVAFTPKGGCPLKRWDARVRPLLHQPVAFTPKGGCPLKHCDDDKVVVIKLDL